MRTEFTVADVPSKVVAEEAQCPAQNSPLDDFHEDAAVSVAFLFSMIGSIAILETRCVTVRTN